MSDEIRLLIFGSVALSVATVGGPTAPLDVFVARRRGIGEGCTMGGRFLHDTIL